MYRIGRVNTEAHHVAALLSAHHQGGAAGSVVALIAALCSPLDAIGDSWLLSAHMAQHILLSDIAPALLVLGLRAPLLPLGLPRGALAAIAPGGRYGRLIGILTSPWVALPLWSVA